MLKTYKRSCHCGTVKFEADLDLAQSTHRCNCSICRRSRFWVASPTPIGKMYGVNIGCLEGIPPPGSQPVSRRQTATRRRA